MRSRVGHGSRRVAPAMALGAALVALSLGRAAPVRGQGTADTGTVAAGDTAGPAVLPVGLRLQYGLSLGPIHAAHATLTVGDARSLEGVEAYPVTLQVQGGALFFTLDDSLVSWIATDPLRTLRSDRSIHEGPHHEVYRLELSAGDGLYRIEPLPGADGGPSADRPRSGPTPKGALDDVAVLFLPRTLPLAPGADYVIPRFYRETSDPIRMHVAERTSLRTPAGRFDVVGLDVVIPNTGLFAEKRHARVYVTDDSARTVVQLTAETALGKLTLYLTGAGK